MTQIILNGTLLDDYTELTLHELCCACSGSEEWVVELVEEGVLEPINLQSIGYQQTQWVFSASNLQQARIARRLQRDLRINTAGIALALNLMEQIETLEARLRRLDISDDM